jgi:hypothetical protein
MSPSRLLTSKLVNPGVPPCCVHVAAIARRLLSLRGAFMRLLSPWNATMTRVSASPPAAVGNEATTGGT